MSLFTCFRCFVQSDCSQEEGRPVFLLVTEEYGAVFGMVYSIVSLFMTFALFNVIVAIFVENTLAAAKGNDVLKKRQRNQDEQQWAEKTQDLVHCMVKHKKKAQSSNEKEVDIDHLELTREAGEMKISKQFFKELILEADFCERVRELDIASEDIPDLFDTFDADDSGTLTMVELLKGIKKLRGDPRRSDVIGVSLVVQAIHDLVLDQTDSIKVLSKRMQHTESALKETLSKSQRQP